MKFGSLEVWKFFRVLLNFQTSKLLFMAQRIYLNLLIKNPRSSKAFSNLAKRIEAGEVFVYPTETIYGIGGRGDRKAVRDRIIKAKLRKPENPMILLAGNKKVFERLGIVFPAAGAFLARKFWPGQLTLVLPSRKQKEFIGVRVSDHPFIKKLYGKLSVPVFSTSANLSGRPYVNSPDEIFSTFAGKVDFMVDAGRLPPSPPSTVVKVINDKKIEVVREGAVSVKEILTAFVRRE
jgi:L-threonylcarbamoyladenylate synthase